MKANAENVACFFVFAGLLCSETLPCHILNSEGACLSSLCGDVFVCNITKGRRR